MKLCTKMESISVFSDIGKFADFRWENADVNRTQGVCQVIHIFFGSSLGKLKLPSFIIVRYVWQIIGRRRRGLFGAPLPRQPWAAPKRPVLNRVNGSCSKNFVIFAEKYSWESLLKEIRICWVSIFVKRSPPPKFIK